MGLGGVAIAVPPYVIHPKTAVLGRAGGACISYGNIRLRQKITSVCLTVVIFIHSLYLEL